MTGDAMLKEPVTRPAGGGDGAAGPAREGIWPRVIREVADDLAADAPARDRAGKPPLDEVGRLKEAGLLARLTPPRPGQQGADWRSAAALVREIAAADGSVGELLAHHCALAWSARFYGGPAGTTERGGSDGTQSGVQQGARENGAQENIEPGSDRLDPAHGFESRTAHEQWLLAGAVEPAGKERADCPILSPAEGGYVLDGRQDLAAGVGVADRLVVGARCPVTGDRLVAVVDPARPGVSTQNTHDLVGQRLTGSGSVLFDRVAVPAEDILGSTSRDEHAVRPRAALAPVALRLLLTQVALGVTEGALAETRDVSRAASAAPPSAGTDDGSLGNRLGEDPYVLLAYGELATALHAAVAVVERATDAVAQGLLAGPGLAVDDCADIAALVSAAETVTARSAVRITTRVLELTGAFGAASHSPQGFDRFWRDARALTLRIPAAHRLRDIGDHYLNGTRPGLARRP
ncbi:acyl-CoA dehydrogenase family protein [Streptomyces sp. NPDC006283]|uniref:acyl-CoA dehydrogenase family protein n=1 Tax=Streptomyces sp. NPDC006283 TaxID=3156741 RepID=UPI0033A4ADA8